MAVTTHTTLADTAMPMIAFVRQFQRQPGGDAAALSIRFEQLIGALRRDALDAGFSAADADDALFAVLAWADEVVLAAPWPGAADWPRYLLQKRHFNVSTAGVAFFTRLDALQPHQLPVREVYALCLGLGFSGRYGYERNGRALEELKRHSVGLLLAEGEGLPAGADKLLFPDGYGAALPPPPPSAPGWRARWRFSSLTLNAVALPLLALALLYLVYHAILWRIASNMMQQMP